MKNKSILIELYKEDFSNECWQQVADAIDVSSDIDIVRLFAAGITTVRHGKPEQLELDI